MFGRYRHFGFYGFLGFIDVVIVRVARLCRWLGEIVAKAFPPERQDITVLIGLSRDLAHAAKRVFTLVGAGTHAKGVGIYAAVPIGFERHDRRAGFALA